MKNLIFAFNICRYVKSNAIVLASINLKFFFFFNNFNASLSKPFEIITSRNNLFNSIAKSFLIWKLHDTIPPKALIGSHASANL